MGDMADWQIEVDENNMIRDSMPEWYGRKREVRKLLWTTANGDVLEPKDMTTQHIENCIAKMERENRGAEAIEFFKKELKSRGVSYGKS